LWACEKTSIRRDDFEWQLSASGGRFGEVKRKASRDSGVQEAKAVLAGLDVQIGPRLAVDVNNVAPDACLFA
jgi:hypothetical protein